jgi:hypothetical protein
MPRRPRTGLLLGGTLLLGLLILGPAGAAVAASGQVCLGVVIDDGPNSTEQNWAPVAAQGAQVAPGTSDLQAMATAGDTPIENNSGLVCAINNFPADGLDNCLSLKDGQYFYWSYWEGDPYTNTWTYANAGPASHTVSSGQTYVEGWRFQDPGPDNQSATKPSVTPAAAFAQGCPGVQPVPAGGSGGSGGSGGGGGGSGSGGSSGGGSSPGSPGPSASATTTTAVAGSGSGPRHGSGAPATSGSGTTTTTHLGKGGPAPAGGAQSTTTTSSEKSPATKGDGRAALSDARSHGASGGGDPALPIVIVAAVIVLLAGLAWWRWRRRPVEE